MKRAGGEPSPELPARKPKGPKVEPPVCNVANLLEICDEDVDFAVELVGDGGGEMAGHAAKAVERATARDDDWLTKLKTRAHSIKGVAGNLGMERLQAHAATTESWAREREKEEAEVGDGALALAKAERLVALVAEVVEWGLTARESLEAHAAEA